MKPALKLQLSLFFTVALTVGLGWIYQEASGTLCYSKLAFVYLGNIIFWSASVKPVSKAFTRKVRKKKLFVSFVLVGLPTLIFNQLIVYFFVEGLFSLFYSCESNLLLSELILTNGLLSNFVALIIIIVGTNYENILLKFREKNDSENIHLKQNGSIHVIKPSDIVMLEADNNAVNIHTTNKRFVQYGRLKDWEAKLRNNGLIRVHRSFIINKEYIQAFQTKPSGDGILTLYNGDKIKVSRNYRSNLYYNGRMLAS